MNTSKLQTLIARQSALEDAIRSEQRLSRQRKQKALFKTIQKLGLLDLTDDQLESALRIYTAGRNTTGNEGEMS